MCVLRNNIVLLIKHIRKMEAQTKNNQTDVVNDEKTRQMAILAKAAAKQDMKASNADKPSTTKVEAEKKPKKEPVISVTSIIDSIVTKGGTWAEIVEKCNEATKGKGNIKYTASVLKAHVRYRTITQKRNDYLGEFTMTDEDIMPAKPKAKGKK